MKERDFWHDVRDLLLPYGALRRVENRCDLGTPDTAYCLRRNPRATPCSGWIEMKKVDRWPVRAKTPFLIPTLTLDQVLWHESWARAGGRVWTLAKAEDAVLLLSPSAIRFIFDRQYTAKDAWEAAHVRSRGPFPTTEVLKCLTA